jgi:hypothetical protein
LLPASLEAIQSRLDDDQVVLDIGAWAKPLTRADWIVDLMPYESRGLLGGEGGGPERFSAETWLVRDICAREPLPFGDDEIDFAICSHTLEDVRDPIWVCSELGRVAKAGYVEVPSRLEEQCYGVNGPWVGWSHHRWLVDLVDGVFEFVAKPGMLEGRADLQFPSWVREVLSPEDRVVTHFWEGQLTCRERIFYEPAELDDYLAQPVRERRAELEARRATRSLSDRSAGFLRRARRLLR